MAKQIDPADIQVAFGMPPEKAVEYLKKKGYAITFDWKELSAAAHRTAFTVAKVTSLSLLTDMHTALQKAIETGQTAEQFREGLEPLLKAKGWWGKGEVTDPETGKKQVAQLGSPWRLNLIYRQNLQSSYMAGRRAEQQEVATTRPYIQYLVVADNRNSSICRGLRGAVLRADDPFAVSHYPPFHFGCRTRVITLSAKQLARLGLTPITGDALNFTPAKGFDEVPGTAPQPDLSKVPPALAKGFTEAMKDAPPAPIPSAPAQAPTKLSPSEALKQVTTAAGISAEQLAELQRRAKAGNLSAKAQLNQLKKQAVGLAKGNTVAPPVETPTVAPGIASPTPTKPTPKESVPAPMKSTAQKQVPKTSEQPESAVDRADVQRAVSDIPMFKRHLDALNGKKLKLKGVSAEQQAALTTYTDEFFEGFNQRLRAGKPSTSDQAMLRIINGALAAGPKYNGTKKKLVRNLAFRTEKEMNAFLARHQQGATVQYQTPTSTCTDGRFMAGLGLRVQCLIESKSGVMINQISATRGENEVLLPSDLVYEVVKVEKVGSMTVIHMRDARK